MSSLLSRDSRQPFTVLLPDTPRTPIEIHDNEVGLAMAVVDKTCVALLDPAWNATGVYLLLGNVQDDGTYTVYVGKSPSGLRTRLMEHERQRKWSRALLIRRVFLHGFTSAHAGWLEGDLYELFSAAERAITENKNTPGDDTVPPYELRMLGSLRDPIVRVLRLLGFETESAPEAVELPLDTAPDSFDPEPARATTTVRRRTRTSYDTSLADLIDAGFLHEGDRLTSTSNAWPANATVNADATITWNGTRFPSASAAASAVRDGAATNGWDFWAVDVGGTTTRLSAIRQRLLDQEVATSPAATMPRPFQPPSPAELAPRAVSNKAPGLSGGERKPRREFNVSVPDLLRAGLLKGGDPLVSTQSATPASATVNYDGTITWNGTPYASPSTAAQAFRGDSNTNGWTFWAVSGAEGDVPLDRLRKRLLKADEAPNEPTGSPAFYGVGMTELVNGGLIAPGDLLVSTSPAYPAVAYVSPDGTVTYNGTQYDTPSAAGAAARQGKATNGWSFWAREQAGAYRRLADIRADYLDTENGDRDA